MASRCKAEPVDKGPTVRERVRWIGRKKGIGRGISLSGGKVGATKVMNSPEKRDETSVGSKQSYVITELYTFSMEN